MNNSYTHGSKLYSSQVSSRKQPSPGTYTIAPLPAHEDDPSVLEENQEYVVLMQKFNQLAKEASFRTIERILCGDFPYCEGTLVNDPSNRITTPLCDVYEDDIEDTTLLAKSLRNATISSNGILQTDLICTFTDDEERPITYSRLVNGSIYVFVTLQDGFYTRYLYFDKYLISTSSGKPSCFNENLLNISVKPIYVMSANSTKITAENSRSIAARLCLSEPTKGPERASYIGSNYMQTPQFSRVNQCPPAKSQAPAPTEQAQAPAKPIASGTIQQTGDTRRAKKISATAAMKSAEKNAPVKNLGTLQEAGKFTA